MDIIDHWMYTATNATRGVAALASDYIAAPLFNPAFAAPPAMIGNYLLADRERFVTCQDSSIIERAIQKHWFDMVNGPVLNYLTPRNDYFDSAMPPLYHIAFGYMIENSRIVQIFERLIVLFQTDELMGVADPANLSNQLAFQWIINTENLFFKEIPSSSYRNIGSMNRPNSEANRRNAYYRLLGMDLAFGDKTNGSYRANASNTQFVGLFEQLLVEIWQAYTNARNSIGSNSTDYQRMNDLIRELRRILMARRGAGGTINLGQYRFMNLSREEYSSVAMMSWLYFIISYNTSPLVTFLGCQANNAAERLIKIGRKVGVEAHKKTQSLFDLAGPLNNVLRQIETGTFEVLNWLRVAIESQVPAAPPAVNPANAAQQAALVDFLIIINNWELATGHKIKNREANVNGTFRIAQMARGSLVTN